MIAVTAALVGPPVGAVAATPRYTVVNGDHDHSRGVYLRNSANTNDVTRTAAHEVMYGNHVRLTCWTWGTAVGSLKNKMWYRVSAVDGPITGKTGYINDHYLNTPAGANKHVAGVPACSPPPKTPTTKPTSAGPSASAIAKGKAAAARALYLLKHDPKIKDRYGEVGYMEDCIPFVRDMWNTHGAGVNLGSGSLPVTMWQNHRGGITKAGKVHPTYIGSLVFFKGASAAKTHVEIYVGNNTYVSSGYHSTGKTVIHAENWDTYANAHGEYGWWFPTK